MATPPRRIILSNDDGVPSPESPFIEKFVQSLYRNLGLKLEGMQSSETAPWKDSALSVVIPSSQKSWIGKAFLISNEVEVSYYDHWFPAPRPLTLSSGASDPNGTPMIKEKWTLLDGTPSTCVNIGLHNLNEASEVDLVLSGPNYGRNVSNLTFSSGTIGAALDGVLCGKKAIAISFAFYKGVKYTDEEVDAACDTACRLILQLWNSWPSGIDLFNINVPIVGVSDAADIKVCLTNVHRIQHEGFFAPVQASFSVDQSQSSVPTAYRFAPAFPFGVPKEPHRGTDAWAIDNKIVSVTPIQAVWSVPDLNQIRAELGDGFTSWAVPSELA